MSALRNLSRRTVALLLALAVVGAAAILMLTAGDSDDALVVYNGRSHYGGDEAFEAFEQETGIEVELFGGEAETLHQRLISEGDETPADVLVTVDGANLWRAKDEGLLAELPPAALEGVAKGLRDPDGTWTAVSTRVRTPVVSTERVDADAITSYEDLGDPEWSGGRLCLRTSTSIYNQSLVADMISKRGEEETRELLESWMANDPQILGSDVEVLEAIAGGQCDVGLTNHYYLARELADDPEFPVAPSWADQDGAGAHANLSGVGVVASTDRRAQAVQLVEFLQEQEAQEAIAANGEFPSNEAVPPAEHISEWADVKVDPMDVQGAGEHAEDAVALMTEVGWS